MSYILIIYTIYTYQLYYTHITSYICVYIYIYIYISFMYIYIYKYIHVYTPITHIYLSIYIYMRNMHISLSLYIYIYIYIYRYISQCFFLHISPHLDVHASRPEVSTQSSSTVATEEDHSIKGGRLMGSAVKTLLKPRGA